MSRLPAHPPQRVLVIGAGPAGVAAAMRLHALGLHVLLVDRAAFPRPKVCGCCLNLAALSALAVIDCDHLVRSLAPTTLTTWRLATPVRTIEASLPGGMALSRLRMDAALVAEAVRRGIEVAVACEAKIVDAGLRSVDVRLGGSAQTQRFDAAILASGLSGGGVARWLPWIDRPAGPLGVGTIVERLDSVSDRTIQIACDESGYVGLVRLEDGRVDVAAALRRGWGDAVSSKAAQPAKAALLQSINGILQRTGQETLPDIDPDALLTTPPLRRWRQPGWGRLLAVGDAAGYVEPFTGEGMAWAIQSGIAAADCLADRSAVDSGATWTVRYAQLMRRRQWLCRLLSGALASPAQSRWLLRLSVAAPWAIRYAVRQLNRVDS